AQVNGVIARLKNLADYDPKLKEVLEVLEPAQVQLQEAVYSLRHYQQKLDLERRIVMTKAKQAQFRKVADDFGIEWRKEAKISDQKEQEAIDRLRAKLDKMEAEALAEKQATSASREAAR
ncbi:MAG: hypothetical protein JJE34_03605, partial [Alphaproteobacteria bacterium]|nr:hypothetical protein [Alphaproteobacteria bacterium]